MMSGIKSFNLCVTPRTKRDAVIQSVLSSIGFLNDVVT